MDRSQNIFKNSQDVFISFDVIANKQTNAPKNIISLAEVKIIGL